MTRQFEGRSDWHQLIARDAEDAKFLLAPIGDVNVLSIGIKRDAFGECAHLSFTDLAHSFAIGPEQNRDGGSWRKNALFGTESPEPSVASDTAYPPTGLTAKPSGPSPTTI
jgi:hypothetical protein